MAMKLKYYNDMADSNNYNGASMQRVAATRR